MTEKRKKSNPDPTSLALEAANQALAAANAAVQAAVRALAITRRQKDADDAARRGRGSIRSAASQARHRLNKADDNQASGVAPLAGAAPTRRPTAKSSPPAATRPAAEAPAPQPAPPRGSAFAARKRGAPADPPLETPSPSRGRAGMRKVMEQSIEQLAPHALPTESQPLSSVNGPREQHQKAAPHVPEGEAIARPTGSGPIILGAGPPTTEAPLDEAEGGPAATAAPAPPAPAGPSGADLRELARHEAELEHREAELAEREAAMARYPPMEPAHPVPAKPQAEDNGYTVLVVDDEEQVRALTMRILSRFGYRVLEASGVELALSILDQDSSRVDLVLSDVAMPGLSGKDLFRAISESRPGLPVVFMSGYALGVYAPEGLIEEGVKMLPKPFGQEDLLDFVVEALQSAAAR